MAVLVLELRINKNINKRKGTKKSFVSDRVYRFKDKNKKWKASKTTGDGLKL